MMRTSAPLSKRWVANVCRRVCTVTVTQRADDGLAQGTEPIRTLGSHGTQLPIDPAH
jgi:hypothetical protein